MTDERTVLTPRWITFDFGDTLVTSEPSYLERVTLGLAELGAPRSQEEVVAAYLSADLAVAQELLPRAPFSPEQFRETFSAAFFQGLGLLDRASELGPPLYQKLIELRPRRVLMEGARELLEKLHDEGYALGIISNNDGYTRKKCEDVGIAHFFQFILDSTVEGIMKPDPRIFHKALALARVQPRELLHVGDLYGCDALGPRTLGITAVWLQNDLIQPEPAPGVHHISRLLDLLDLLKK